MTEKPYHRLIVWKPQFDAEVRKIFLEVFGQFMLQKSPLQNRVDHRLMVGTSMFTEEKEALMKERLGDMGSVLKKEPLLWWSI